MIYKGLLLCLLLLGTLSCKNIGKGQIKTDAGGTLKVSPLINVKSAKEILIAKTSTFIDVRTPEEIAKGKIENALELDFFDESFGANISQLDKEKSYVVYCKSGGRSAKAQKLMQNMGFTATKDLDGGYTQWIKENN